MSFLRIGMTLGMLLFTTSAFASDVDGKWSGMVDTPNGALQIVFTFKADGSGLSGAQNVMNGPEIPIKRGKIERDKISFEVEVNFDGMPTTLSYSGVVFKDQIKLTAEFGGGAFEYVVKKVP